MSEPLPLTVTLEWSAPEADAKPYLRLVRINSFDWNP